MMHLPIENNTKWLFMSSLCLEAKIVLIWPLNSFLPFHVSKEKTNTVRVFTILLEMHFHLSCNSMTLGCYVSGCDIYSPFTRLSSISVKGADFYSFASGHFFGKFWQFSTRPLRAPTRNRPILLCNFFLMFPILL